MGFPASFFLLFASVTGIILAATEFFGADEALRERTRALVSPVTLQSPAAHWSEPLAKAFAAAAAKAGGAPVDSVTVAFKGDQPTVTIYTGKPTGGEDRKFVFDARTGTLLRTEDYTDKPFLLRLHSGEVFGDGGLVLAMLWGLALVLLTLSGTVIYFKMRRSNLTGIKRIFWLLALGCAFGAPPRAEAGSPFFTDDPMFVTQGWELKFQGAFEDNVNGDILTAPIWDINYNLASRFKLNLTLAGKGIYPKQGHSAYGLADTDFKFKWRFLDEQKDVWWPNLSIAPNVTLPTADVDRGLGDGFWRARIPMQFGKTFSRTYLFGEGGYQWVFDRQASDQLLYGLGAVYTFTDHFQLGAELNGNAPLQDRRHHALLAGVGATWTFSEHWQFQVYGGRTVRDEILGGPRYFGQVVLQWDF